MAQQVGFALPDDLGVMPQRPQAPRQRRRSTRGNILTFPLSVIDPAAAARIAAREAVLEEERRQAAARAKRIAARKAYTTAIIEEEKQQAERIASMRKTRRCLSCDRQFASHGPGNRICLKCKDLDAWSSPPEFTTVAAF